MTAIAVCAGCDDGDGTTGTGGDGGAPAACGPADRTLADGRCQPPGLPIDMPCAPGETPLEDGSCQAAGVPPSKCGDGFEADGEGGCRPILPEDPCLDGLMAIPGETECREIGPCGEGTWGDIPVEPNTQFVDGSYAGMDSDGSQRKPWKTVAEGLDAAEDGAIVAIAAGTYPENVSVTFGPKRLWGRCPSMVTIAGGAAGAVPAVTLLSDGAEVHDLAITGAPFGVVTNADGVLVERVHVHDTDSAGVLVDGGGLTLRASLVERPRYGAVVAQSGGQVTVESSVLRQCLATPDGFGRGVDAIPGGGKASAVTVRWSLIERTNDAAVAVYRSDLTMESTAVRDTEPLVAQGSYGVGISVIRGAANIVGSTVERAHTTGVELGGAVATLERVTVKDTLPPPKVVPSHRGVTVLPEAGVPSQLTLRESTISGSPHMGVHVLASSALIESTLVRRSNEDIESPQNAAITVQAPEATVTIRRCDIAENRLGGLVVKQGQVSMESSVIRDMALDVVLGICAGVFSGPGEVPGTLAVSASLITGCALAGAFAYQAHLLVHDSILGEVYPDELGFGGDGVIVVNETEPNGTLEVVGTLFEAPARAGIASFGGQVTLGHDAITCAKYAIVSEPSGAFSASFAEQGPSVCGCPDADAACAIESPGLENVIDL